MTAITEHLACFVCKADGRTADRAYRHSHILFSPDSNNLFTFHRMGMEVPKDQLVDTVCDACYYSVICWVKAIPRMFHSRFSAPPEVVALLHKRFLGSLLNREKLSAAKWWKQLPGIWLTLNAASKKEIMLELSRVKPTCSTCQEEFNLPYHKFYLDQGGFPDKLLFQCKRCQWAIQRLTCGED